MTDKFVFQHIAKRGVAVLPLVIIVSFIILIIGTTAVFVIFFENQAAFSARKAAEALAAAQAGLNDALQKIVYNPNLSSGDYQLTINGATASTTVARGDPCPNSQASRYFIIISLGRAQNRQRQIRAVIAHNCLTGQTTVVSVREIEV